MILGSEHHRNYQQQRFFAVSPFSDLWVAERKDSVAVQFQYNIATDDVTTQTQGSGSVTQSDAKAYIATGTTANSDARVSSRKALRYLPGHEGYAFFTATFTTLGEPGSQKGIPETDQYIGLYSSDNGYFIGFHGENFVVVRRKEGTDYITSQQDFNGDTLDESGRYRIDFSKLNVYRIRFGWLGAAVVIFEVMRPTGNWLEFHRILHPGTSADTTVNNPVLPIAAYVENGTTQSNVTISTASWNAGNTGGNFLATERYKSFGNEKSLSAGVLTNIFTLRSKESFHGKPNRVLAVPLFISAASDSTQITRIEILKNSELGGTPNYQSIDPVNSVIEFDTAGTNIVGIGETVISMGITRQNSVMEQIRDMNITIEPGDTLSFAALTAGTAPVFISARWAELF